MSCDVPLVVVAPSPVGVGKDLSSRGLFVSWIASSCSGGGNARLITAAVRSHGKVRFGGLRRTVDVRFRFGHEEVPNNR